jgi:hypothetical protein
MVPFIRRIPLIIRYLPGNVRFRAHFSAKLLRNLLRRKGGDAILNKSPKFEGLEFRAPRGTCQVGVGVI